MKKIVICEDHPIYSNGLEDFLKDYFQVSGIFKSGLELISFLKNNKIDILLLDLNLIDINGVEVIETLKNLHIKPKIVVISMYNDKMLIEKCKKLNIHGYCSKHVLNSELLEILNNLEDDVFVVDSSIKEKINTFKTSISKESFEKKINLTKREKELITLISKGFSTKEIANELFVSTFTVDTHKKNIYKKLDIKSVAELVTFYHENL